MATRSIDDLDIEDEDDDDLGPSGAIYLKADRLKAKKAVESFILKMNMQNTSLDSILKIQKTIEKSYNTIIRKGVIAEEGLRKKINIQLQEYLKKGFDINKLTTDIESRLAFDLKVIESQKNLSKKRKEEFETIIINQYNVDKKILDNKRKINESLDRVLDKIPSLGGFGDSIKEKISKRKDSAIAGMDSGKTNVLTKIMDKLGKFPLIIGGIAAAIGFIISRLFSLVSAEIALNSQLTKETGLRASGAAKIQGQVSGAREKLKVFYGGDTEEAQKKVIEATGSLLKEFGHVSYITKERIVDIVSLSEKLGISTRESAKYFSVLTQSLGMGDEQIKSFGNSLERLTKDSGQSLADVTQDIADSSEFAAIYGSRFGNSLAKAAVTAKSIGSSLKEVGDFSQKFTTIDSAFENIRDLNILLGKKYNAFQFIATSRRGGSEQQAEQLKKILNDVNEARKMGNDITQDSYNLQKLANIVTNGDVASLTKKLNLMKEGKTIEQAEAAIRKEKQREQKRIKTLSSYAESLGITELKTPQELILAKILEAIDKFLIPVAIKIAEYTFKGMMFLSQMIDNFDIKKIVATGLISSGNAALGSSLFSSSINENSDAFSKAFGNEIKSGGEMYEKLNKKALGGIISSPHIAGEAGPEAILPLTGPGKESFTKPFLDKNSGDSEISKQLKELNNNIKALLNKKSVIENKVYMDTRMVAKSLTEAALIAS